MMTEKEINVVNAVLKENDDRFNQLVREFLSLEYDIVEQLLKNDVDVVSNVDEIIKMIKKVHNADIDFVSGLLKYVFENPRRNHHD